MMHLSKIQVSLFLVSLLVLSLFALFCKSDPVVYPDYIYFGGDTAGTIWKVQESDMSKVAESPSYGGNINAIAEDNHYLYVGGENGDDDVWKIQKNNMAVALVSIPYDDRVNAIVADDDYIYVAGGGGAGSFDVWKIQKSDMVKDAAEINYGGAMYAMAIDDDYIYVGGGATRTVQKIQKSDMTLAAETVNYGGVIQSISVDDTYVYFGGMTTNTVRKVQKSDMVQVDETANLCGSVYAVSGKAGNDYVYVGGAYMRIKKIQKSDMVEVLQSGAYTAGTMVIEDIYGDHIYVGGGDEVWQMLKSDLSKVAESGDYGDAVGAISGVIETESESIPLSITIDTPSETASAGSITIDATVEHFGLNDLTDIPMYCNIYLQGEVSTLEDFETDNGSCSTSGELLWDWGVPSVVGPGTTHSGTKCWGTVLDDDYAINSDAYLDLPPMTVVENETITFWHWYAVENHYDNCYLKISIDDGESWVTLATYTNTNAAWEKVEINLNDYNYTNVIIRFHLDSDASEVDAGWYIDDVTRNVTWNDTPVYAETTTVDVDAESTGVATFAPAWVASNGVYNLLMGTELTGEDARFDNNTHKIVTISGSSNVPPNITCVFPANESIDVSLTPQLYVICTDADSDAMNATWWSNSSGAWVQFASNWTSFANNTNITQSNSNFSDYSTTYWWSVNVSDGEDWTNDTYHFTTVAAGGVPAPRINITCIYPVNGSLDVAREPQCQIYVDSPDIATVSVSFYYERARVWVLGYTEPIVALNSTVYWNFTKANDFATLYNWRAVADDGVNETIGNYSFTTNVDTSETKGYSTPPPDIINFGEDYDSGQEQYVWAEIEPYMIHIIVIIVSIILIICIMLVYCRDREKEK